MFIDTPYNELSIDWTPGRSQGRTMTETDVVNFCMLTGNWLEIHSNKEFSKDSHFGKRIVQGSLVFSVLAGLAQFGPVVSAFYGVDKLRFLKPVFIGDTVWVEPKVIFLKEKSDKHGVATFLMNIVNQRDEVVQTSEFSLLLWREHPNGK